VDAFIEQNRNPAARPPEAVAVAPFAPEQRPAPRTTSRSPAGLQVLKLPPNWPLPGSTPP
jgi:hypothetical protein